MNQSEEFREKTPLVVKGDGMSGERKKAEQFRAEMLRSKGTEPSLMDEFKAHWDVVPGSLFIFFSSITVALARFAWGMWNELGVIESTGLFSPWFAPWVVCFVISFNISNKSEKITLKAKNIHSARKRAEYGTHY